MKSSLSARRLIGAKKNRFALCCWDAFGVALISFVLYWTALPPVGCWGLVFVVPALWTFFLRKNDVFSLNDRVLDSPNNGRGLDSSNRSDEDLPEKASSPSKRRGGFSTFLKGIRSFFDSFYGKLWFASYLFWLVVAFWLTFPHPATSLGWLAVAFVLAPYFPLFIALTRTLVYRWNVSIFLAAPVVWVGMEWFRKHLFGGFSFASLEHSLFRQPILIQLAFPIGEYVVGAFVVLVGIALGLSVRFPGDSWGLFERLKNRNAKDKIADGEKNVAANDDSGDRLNDRTGDSGGGRSTRKTPSVAIVPLCVALSTFAFAWAWGKFQLDRFDAKRENLAVQNSTFSPGLPNSPESSKSTTPTDRTPSNSRPVRVALLQDGTTFAFPVSEELNTEIHYRYLKMTNEAAFVEPRPDLIVWPESCFADPFYLVAENGFFPGMESLDPSERDEETRSILQKRDRSLFDWINALKTSLLLGALTVEFDANGSPSYYNSAWLVSPKKEMKQRYDKSHLVVFGEYLPFERYLPDWFPLKTLCSSVTPGRPELFWLDVRDDERTIPILVNICFEGATPHLIFAQIDELFSRYSSSPQILVNISNDGWFRQIWQIDYHLATNVFRAVENRVSVLSATHGGFSAAIDPTGTILNCGERGATETVFADVDPRLSENFELDWSIFRAIPAVCAIFSVFIGLCAWGERFRNRRQTQKRND